MSKNILIRDLSEDQQQKLETLRESFGEKTTSKTILHLIDRFQDLKEENRRLRIEKQNIQAKVSPLERLLKNIEDEVKEAKNASGTDDWY